MKCNLKFADNGVMIEHPKTHARKVIEYGEGENKYTPIMLFLGKKSFLEIIDAEKVSREAVQEWEMEVTIKPKE